MGRGGKRFGRGRGGKRGGGGSGERQAYKSFEELRRDNANLRKYYTAQNLVGEDEFPALIEAMRTILPTNFRITGSRQQAMDIREQIVGEFVPHIRETTVDGAEIEAPHPLEWYPNGLGWQFSIPRIALKKSKELSRFHSFLVTETEVGNISRQEAVSMVPPLLLDVQPSHWVLDMCAAPGSKTAQLVEAVEAGAEPGRPPSGLVVANDADYKRACMLVHQMNRLSSPNVVVTNHSGEQFPNIYRPGSPREVVQFDRILCDVPCSGDGTTRKNVRVWETWRPDDAHTLNPVQSKILQRAVHLLKTGGRLVYSTCSLNPVENEAVVAHVLDRFGAALRLVDVSAELPALKRRPGLSTWKVMARDGSIHGSPETIVPETLSRSHYRNRMQLFPLAPARMAELGIERCLRIYPHLQNTGGFFVAVIEKVAPITADEKRRAAREGDAMEEDEDAVLPGDDDDDDNNDDGDDSANVNVDGSANANDDEDDDAAGVKRLATDASDIGADDAEAKRPKVDGKGGSRRTPFQPDCPREGPALRENPFVFLDARASELQGILDYYGVRESMSRRGFLSRIEDGSFRSIYYVAEPVRQLMELAGQRLRVVNTGIRVFNRNCVKDAGCAFRLVGEGVSLLLPHLDEKYVVDVSLGDLQTLLEHVNPLLSALSEGLQERLRAVDPSSSVVVRYDPAAAAAAAGSAEAQQQQQQQPPPPPHARLTATLTIPCWRGHASVSVHVSKTQLSSLIHRVLGRTVDRNGADGTRLDNNGRTEATAATETIGATTTEPEATEPEATEPVQ
ncbi:tRNA (cytosine-5-)-methyltransferase ncl1 [Coemansia javaensis]|uniref:tRNA (Cytosine-5-)-methyltransferase ncl1 n=1 Tax=Coemansia javaensis TaxID=2761396 RepID=A0A9W8H6T0_9FUNG|nr:tRNA (cytosine-5-)-methyltransferase ncl1 [Coemansia javaensis]